MAAKIMFLALAICYFGSLTLGASMKGKIEKLDNVIRDLEKEVEVLAELQDPPNQKVVLRKKGKNGMNIIEVNKGAGTDKWIKKFCKTHGCKEQEGDEIMSLEQVQTEKDDNRNLIQGDPIKPVAGHWKKVYDEYECKLEVGDGATRTGGVDEKKLEGKLKPEECIRRCSEEAKNDPSINGVTISNDNEELKDCWCERNMARVLSNVQTYKTCYLVPKSGSQGRIVVPYAFADSIDANTKSVILEAIEEYKTKACIDWVPVENAATTYHVEFIKGNGCYSYVGLASSFLQGKQPISIGNGCAYKGTVIHEMLHCMGFFHEQSRPDRDDYVKIYLENVMADRFKNNFAKQAAAMVDSQGVGYDINSVMHYGPTYFANQGTYTILKKVAGGDPVVFTPNRAGFSDSDLKQLNLMYQCAAAPVATVAPTPTPTPTPVETEAPDIHDPRTCIMLKDLGFCGYPMIKDVCPECAGNDGEGLILNLYSAENCDKWAKKKYCADGHKFKSWMFGNCLKECIDTNYPIKEGDREGK